MPTRNTKRNSRAAQTAPEAPKAGRNDHMNNPFANAQCPATHRTEAEFDAGTHDIYTNTHINPSSGDQRVVPQPAKPVKEGPTHTAHTPLEPQKSQEACCLTDDDDHTRADDDKNQIDSKEGDEEEQQQLQIRLQHQQQQQQEDADAAAAEAEAAAILAVAAAERRRIREEDDEDDDPSFPKPRPGSEIGAEAMDSVIEDFREGAVRQRNKRKAAKDAAGAQANSEPGSGDTIDRAGIEKTHSNKRFKHDTGANSRHKDVLHTSIPMVKNKIKNGNTAGGAGTAVINKNKNNKKDEQPSNGGGSGEGSNEPSGSQMAAVGGVAMDNGSDESGEECKSAEQPLPQNNKTAAAVAAGAGGEEELENDTDDEEDITEEEESPRKRSRQRNHGDDAQMKEEDLDEEEEERLLLKRQHAQQQKKATFAQAPWLVFPPPPPLIRGTPQQPLTTQLNKQQKRSERQQQRQANANATTGAAAAPTATATPSVGNLQQCASSLSAMHSFYTNAQHIFMAQMQEIMAVAMEHHTHAAVAALTNTGGDGKKSAMNSIDILPAEDVTAISRACATALGIINSISAAPGPAAAAAALFNTTAGGGASAGGGGGPAVNSALMPPPPPPVSALGGSIATASALPSQLLNNMATLPLPLPLYVPLPNDIAAAAAAATTAPPHPLQRNQMSSGKDGAMLHAGNHNNNAGLTGSMQSLLAMPPMVPMLGTAGFIDPGKNFAPGGFSLAAMQMATLPLQMQIVAAAAAAGVPQQQQQQQPAQTGN